MKDTITSDHNKTGLSRDPSDYYITAIVRENFYSAAPYGWRCSTGPDEFVASLRRNLRRRATLLHWESAGTDEPGDQVADTKLCNGYWLLGPNGDGTWSLELVEPGESVRVGNYKSERDATYIAQQWENGKR